MKHPNPEDEQLCNDATEMKTIDSIKLQTLWTE